MAALIVLIAVWVYRQVIVSWCEGRTDIPELALNSAAKRWVVFGALLSVAVILCTLAAVVIGGGEIAVLPHGLLPPGLPVHWDLAVRGVAEELFARGTLFRISEQHVGSLIALVITAVIFGVQHADNPSATVTSTLAVALEGGIMLAAIYMLARTLGRHRGPLRLEPGTVAWACPCPATRRSAPSNGRCRVLRG